MKTKVIDQLSDCELCGHFRQSRPSCILLLLFLLSINTFGQNIVPNYSFEVADSCPVSFNSHTYKYSLGCKYWGQASKGSVDYYNSCDTAAASINRLKPLVGVPENGYGFQNAFDGNAYVGVVMYDSMIPWFKEYLISEIPALQIDTFYRVVIRVSLADSSRFAIDGFGVVFTTYGSPDQNAPGAISVIPQIDFSNYGIISDTVNWISLTAIFKADSQYTNLIIGGFKDIVNTNITAFNNQPSKLAPFYSYYYVDDVSVEKLSSTKISQVLSADISRITPNPFSDKAILSFDNSTGEATTLFLYNILGEMLRAPETTTTDNFTIERKDLSSGLYYYRLCQKQKQLCGKFVLY